MSKDMRQRTKRRGRPRLHEPGETSPATIYPTKEFRAKVQEMADAERRSLAAQFVLLAEEGYNGRRKRT